MISLMIGSSFWNWWDLDWRIQRFDLVIDHMGLWTIIYGMSLLDRFCSWDSTGRPVLQFQIKPWTHQQRTTARTSRPSDYNKGFRCFKRYGRTFDFLTIDVIRKVNDGGCYCVAMCNCIFWRWCCIWFQVAEGHKQIVQTTGLCFDKCITYPGQLQLLRKLWFWGHITFTFPPSPRQDFVVIAANLSVELRTSE